MNGRALLLDIDGTLYVGDEPLPGAESAIRRLEQRGIQLRYLTNTTRFSRRELAERLRAMGFPASDAQLFTAPVAAAEWLRRAGIHRIALYVPDSTLDDFRSFEHAGEGETAEALVVGDLGEAWTFARMNAAFRQLLEGARLVALQRNRYWRTPDGLTIDAGAFVAALEYAAGVRATVVGKPSAEFFRLASDSLPPDAHPALVVGDDVDFRMMLSEFLAAEGYQVREAANVGAAMRHIEDARPSAIVLDCAMSSAPLILEWLRRDRSAAGGLPRQSAGGCAISHRTARFFA